MMQIVLIGLGAGAAAALLFASVASGVIFSVLLFYLSPLPIMIAALGWSHWAGLLAAVVGAAVLGAAMVGAALVTFGGDEASIRSGLKGALEHMLRLQAGLSADDK